jgi:hypothetical protein
MPESEERGGTTQRGAPIKPGTPFAFLRVGRNLFGDEREIFREHGAEAAFFILIVQKYDWHDSQLLFA